MEKETRIFVAIDDVEKKEILLKGTLTNYALLSIVEDSNFDNDTYKELIKIAFAKLN